MGSIIGRYKKEEIVEGHTLNTPVCRVSIGKLKDIYNKIKYCEKAFIATYTLMLFQNSPVTFNVKSVSSQLSLILI